jgi:hypothetical protein
MTKLTILNVEHCALDRIAGGVWSCTSLTQLHLSVSACLAYFLGGNIFVLLITFFNWKFHSTSWSKRPHSSSFILIKNWHKALYIFVHIYTTQHNKLKSLEDVDNYGIRVAPKLEKLKNLTKLDISFNQVRSSDTSDLLLLSFKTFTFIHVFEF